MFDLELPSGLKIKFRAPRGEDRQEGIKKFDREKGIIPEDYMMANCLLLVNGQEVHVNEFDAEPPIEIMMRWELKDILYYTKVFESMFMLDDKAQEGAIKLAKNLMGGSSTTTSTTKK